MEIKIGHSRDIHRLVEGRKLILGGVEIAHSKGLLGHSDADCVLHAVAESILGALGIGDLGTHFPDTSLEYKGMNSAFFVKETCKLLKEHGFLIGNMDITVHAEEPNLKAYKEQMRNTIAALLNVSPAQINVKATRGEGMDSIGRKEAIAAEAVVLILRN